MTHMYGPGPSCVLECRYTHELPKSMHEQALPRTGWFPEDTQKSHACMPLTWDDGLQLIQPQAQNFTHQAH